MGTWPGQRIEIKNAPNAAFACALFESDRERRCDEQPVVDPDVRIAIVADCRLDDRQGLAASLGVSQEVTDSRLLLRAYERWGIEMPAHLCGDFAVAVWDWARRRVLLFRDPLGVKPLYYVTDPEGLAVATDVGALVDILKLPPIPDDQLVVEHLLRKYESVDRSFWSPIKRLPAGHRLEATERNATIHRYWYPKIEDLSSATAETLRDRFRDLFFQSVERRLQTEHPLVAHLSGGVDSSCVVCVADQIYRRKPGSRPQLRSVTASYAGLSCDEQAFVESVIECVNFENETWDGRASRFLDVEDPVSRGPGMRVHRAGGTEGEFEIATRMGARVILSGQGGDQLGAPWGVEFDIVAASPFRYAFNTLIDRQLSRDQRLNRAKGLVRALAPLPFLRAWAGFRPRPVPPSWLRPEWIDLAQGLGTEGRDVDPWMAGMSYTGAMHLRELTAAPLGRALDTEQACAAVRGIEFRYPFLDQDLVNFVLSIPGALWPGQGADARLQRDFLGAYLPLRVRRRRGKADFAIAMLQKMKSASPGLRSLFFDGEWLSGRYVDRTVAQATLERLWATAPDAARWRAIRDVWGIATLEAWLRTLFGYATTRHGESSHELDPGA